ncbi:MAG: hypothetical protein PHW03_03025 [Eubacteriales bacterium]|nr:hypothetical protein [Eubacteriales bacterium]MDD4389758.1 hypothetical protein [Eubacteriales bacterium]
MDSNDLYTRKVDKNDFDRNRVNEMRNEYRRRMEFDRGHERDRRNEYDRRHDFDLRFPFWWLLFFR